MPLAILRLVYGRRGSIAWLVVVTAAVVLLILIALYARTLRHGPLL